MTEDETQRRTTSSTPASKQSFDQHIRGSAKTTLDYLEMLLHQTSDDQIKKEIAHVQQLVIEQETGDSL